LILEVRVGIHRDRNLAHCCLCSVPGRHLWRDSCLLSESLQRCDMATG
jgi:hypothetical protein